MTYQNLITLGQRVRIVYKDGAGDVTERVIDIDRIYACTSKGRCLVTAYCHRRNEYRTFNADNILAAMPDESTTITTFAMSAAVTAQDTEAFHTAYAALHA